MTKHPSKPDSITFRELIHSLADQIGRHHIPVKDGAHHIGELLGADAVHHELIHRIVNCLYKANHCGHLDAQIDPSITFSTLGKIRGDIIRSSHTDIDQVILMDRLGSVIASGLRNQQYTSRESADLASNLEDGSCVTNVDRPRATVTSLEVMRK